MQPIYCTWKANGKPPVHTPGTNKGGRVTRAEGWVNSALGELGKIVVDCENAQAEKQGWATAEITWPDGVRVTFNQAARKLTIERRKPDAPLG